MLVAIEGNNGSGKTTLIKNLEYLLINEQVVSSRYNSTEPINQFIMFLRDTESLMDPIIYEYFQLADMYYRTSVLQEEIEDDNKIVLFDRYIETLLVRDYVRGIERVYGESLCKYLPKPDLTIYLDISPQESLRRVLKRGKLTNRMWCIALRNDLELDTLNEQEYMANLEKMRRAYKNICISPKYSFDAQEDSLIIAKDVYKLILKWRKYGPVPDSD